MEIRDLRSLLAVLRCGSFTGAARELGYTQSAVSQQVSALETELGHRLVERRPVRPTPAGERLAEHAARILLRIDVARSELAHFSEPRSALTVAASPLASPLVLGRALRALGGSDPSLDILVRSVAPHTTVTEVASGAADAALVDGVTTPGEPLHLADAGLLVSVPIAETPLVVVLATGHPLLRRALVDLDALADAPWVRAPNLIADERFRDPLRAGRPTGIVYDGFDAVTLLALVAAGLGAALLPATPWLRAEGVGAVAVGTPSLIHRTELVTLRGASGPTALLVGALRAEAPLR